MLTMLLSEANIPNLVGGPGRHEDQAKDPQTSAQIVKWGSNPTQRHCGALIYNVGKTEGQQAPEPGRPASPGPPTLGFWHPRKLPDLPTSWSDQEPSARSRWTSGSRARPDGLGQAARPHKSAPEAPLSREVQAKSGVA